MGNAPSIETAAEFQCLYWITVYNPTDFEMEFAILGSTEFYRMSNGEAVTAPITTDGESQRRFVLDPELFALRRNESYLLLVSAAVVIGDAMGLLIGSTPFDDDLCGTCTACLDACPTDAFPEPYVLDSNKCISYLTIEHRGDLPTELENKLSGWIYGCDICQEVCPWNITFSQLSNENSFKPRENLQERPIPQWEKFTEEDFRILFKKSAVKRTKYSGLKRNITHNIQLKNRQASK